MTARPVAISTSTDHGSSPRRTRSRPCSPSSAAIRDRDSSRRASGPSTGWACSRSARRAATTVRTCRTTTGSATGRTGSAARRAGMPVGEKPPATVRGRSSRPVTRDTTGSGSGTSSVRRSTTERAARSSGDLSKRRPRAAPSRSATAAHWSRGSRDHLAHAERGGDLAGGVGAGVDDQAQRRRTARPRRRQRPHRRGRRQDRRHLAMCDEQDQVGLGQPRRRLMPVPDTAGVDQHVDALGGQVARDVDQCGPRRSQGSGLHRVDHARQHHPGRGVVERDGAADHLFGGQRRVHGRQHRHPRRVRYTRPKRPGQ